MFAVNPAWAEVLAQKDLHGSEVDIPAPTIVPDSAAEVVKEHEVMKKAMNASGEPVLTLSDLNINNYSTSGIAGVTYVNRMVGIAGGAAQEAESHASVAGTYAVSAYNSAKAANDALSDKQDALVPGENIKGSGSVTVTKDGNVITVSGTDTTYTAGENVTITGDNNAINVAAADGDTLGVVKQGTNTTITNGAVNVATANGENLGVVKAGTNTTITSGAVNVANANATTAGVVKIADTNLEQLYDYEGMFENGSYEYGSDEVLSAESVHQATAFMAMAINEIAENVGGISESANAVVTTDSNGTAASRAPGDTMVVNNGVLDAKTASGNSLGVVKQGTNTTITNGAVNVATASASVSGVMKWGEVPAGSPTSTTSAQIWIE